MNSLKFNKEDLWEFRQEFPLGSTDSCDFCNDKGLNESVVRDFFLKYESYIKNIAESKGVSKDDFFAYKNNFDNANNLYEFYQSQIPSKKVLNEGKNAEKYRKKDKMISKKRRAGSKYKNDVRQKAFGNYRLSKNEYECDDPYCTQEDDELDEAINNSNNIMSYLFEADKSDKSKKVSNDPYYDEDSGKWVDNKNKSKDEIELASEEEQDFYNLPKKARDKIMKQLERDVEISNSEWTKLPDNSSYRYNKIDDIEYDDEDLVDEYSDELNDMDINSLYGYDYEGDYGTYGDSSTDAFTASDFDRILNSSLEEGKKSKSKKKRRIPSGDVVTGINHINSLNQTGGVCADGSCGSMSACMGESIEDDFDSACAQGTLPIFEFPNDEYLYLNLKNGELQAGGVTNTGFYAQYTMPIDYDYDLDVNLQNFYDYITEQNPEYLQSYSIEEDYELVNALKRELND